MDSEIMREEYVNEVLKPFSKNLGPNERALLLLDNLSAHKDIAFVSRANALCIDVEYFPPNTTGKLQPLDLSYNPAFKKHYSALWEKWFLDNCMDKVATFTNVNEEEKKGMEIEIEATKKDMPDKQEVDSKISLSKFPSPDWSETVFLIKSARSRITRETVEGGFNIYKPDALIRNSKNIIIKDRHVLSLTPDEQSELMNEWRDITSVGVLMRENSLDVDEEEDESWQPPSNLQELLDLDIDIDVD
jgi:hypothetical protein